MGLSEEKILQCQEEKMVDSCRRVTEGQQIRMNQKKIAKHEEWSRRNIVFLMMRSVDCMWKPFFCRYFAGIEFWSLGCHDYGKHKSTRDHQNHHHDLHQKHVLNIFEYANSPPRITMPSNFKVPRKSSSASENLQISIGND